MHLPEFNAEFAVRRTVTSYTSSSVSSGCRATGLVPALRHLFCPPICAEVCWPPGCERSGGCQYCRCYCPPSFA